MNKIGSNQYKAKRNYGGLKLGTYALALLITLVSLCIAVWCRYYIENDVHRLLSPLGKDQVRFVIVRPVLAESNEIDIWVDQAAKQYGQGVWGYSKLKNVLHCLLDYETKHNYGRGMGDGGLAGGILQFHQGTWVGYRKIMIKRGLATEISDRFNDKDAIFTTAWALVDGRGKAWGPILRNNCNDYK